MLGVALPLGTQVDSGFQAGTLMDRPSYRVVAAALALTLTAGVVYSGPAQGSAAVGVDLGSSAHLDDATSGRILARAGEFDPLTGAFLQRDPSGHQDSVNQYAYGANDPVNRRDRSLSSAVLPMLISFVSSRRSQGKRTRHSPTLTLRTTGSSDNESATSLLRRVPSSRSPVHLQGAGEQRTTHCGAPS